MSIELSTKFLIVDDQESMINVKINQLKALDMNHYLIAKSAQDALKILNEQLVDVILCDDNMPGTNGLEFLKLIRANNQFCRIPFLLVLSETKSGYISEAIACGVGGILVKPYTLGKMLENIERAMNAKPKKLSPVPSVTTSPALGNAAMSASASSTSTGSLKPAQPIILVVDDVSDNLNLLAEIFGDEYDVRFALNGEKALELCCSETPPDLVLLDVMMPNMNGFEVAKKMREHTNSEHIPVIFVTAMTSNESRAQGLELGAVDFITKPIEPNLLKTRVKNFLRYVELYKNLQADYEMMLENSQLKEKIKDLSIIETPLTHAMELLCDVKKDAALKGEAAEKVRMIEEMISRALHQTTL